MLGIYWGCQHLSLASDTDSSAPWESRLHAWPVILWPLPRPTKGELTRPHWQSSTRMASSPSPPCCGSPPNQILIEDGHRGLQTGPQTGTKAGDIWRPNFCRLMRTKIHAHQDFGEVQVLHPGKLRFWTQSHGGLVQMIFRFKAGWSLASNC